MAFLGYSDGVKSATGNVGHCLSGELYDLLWRVDVDVELVAQTAEASIAPGEEVLLLGDCS